MELKTISTTGIAPANKGVSESNNVITELTVQHYCYTTMLEAHINNNNPEISENIVTLVSKLLFDIPNKLKLQIEIKEKQIGKKTISAKNLHKALKIKSRFSKWYNHNSKSFIEGYDFEIKNLSFDGGRIIQKDYIISSTAAWCLSAMSKVPLTNEVCKLIRMIQDLEKSNNEALEMNYYMLDAYKKKDADLAFRLSDFKSKQINSSSN